MTCVGVLPCVLVRVRVRVRMRPCACARARSHAWVLVRVRVHVRVCMHACVRAMSIELVCCLHARAFPDIMRVPTAPRDIGGGCMRRMRRSDRKRSPAVAAAALFGKSPPTAAFVAASAPPTANVRARTTPRSAATPPDVELMDRLSMASGEPAAGTHRMWVRLGARAVVCMHLCARESTCGLGFRGGLATV